MIVESLCSPSDTVSGSACACTCRSLCTTPSANVPAMEAGFRSQPTVRCRFKS